MTDLDTARSRSLRSLAPLAGLIVLLVVIQAMVGSGSGFPAGLDTFFSDPIDGWAAWGRENRLSHWLFTGFFTPLTRFLDSAMQGIEDLLGWLPWFALPMIVFVVIARTRDFKRAGVAAAAMLYPGLFGVWDETLETMALMAIAVAIAVVAGVPLGVWAALRPRIEAYLRPVLDIMQTVPAFVYFLPLMLLFGIGPVNAAFATMIYALPPIVRLTTLGINQVPNQSVEASTVFGSTTRQTLFKVQLPMALPMILTGLSQTIMMALGVVVLASLIGAGGLGAVVLQTLSQRRTGRGIAAGLAIVAVAMVLDRVSRSLATLDRSKLLNSHARNRMFIGATIVIVIGKLVGVGTFPDVWRLRVFDPIDNVVVWARDNLSFLTRPFNDFVIAGVIIPIRDFLTGTLAWPVLIIAVAYACWRVKSWRLGLFGGSSVALIGLIGLWEHSINTFVQVMVAVFFSVLIAVPIGIWAGRNPRIETALGPLLDGLQTIPSLVYIIPVVILFTVGAVPGIIASVLYAIVPGIRITALGIRQVPSETLEASRTFGATPRQTLTGVRIPLAAPTIMAGVNQIIMMVLAMVIIGGLVGSGGLGFEVIRALTRSLNGLGFEVGLAIALIAMVLDRYTEAWADRFKPPDSTQ